MTRIIKVLEAADRLVEGEGEPVVDDYSKGDVFAFCKRPFADLVHADDCPWQALLSALKELS